MEEEIEKKWEGEAEVELKSVKAEEIWPMLEDFCSIHKWFPFVDTSYQLEGESGKPGLVRYCTIKVDVFSEDGANPIVQWAKEKLLTMDPIRRCFSYQVLDSNLGLDGYVATMEVVPVPVPVPMDGDGNGGCKIKWSFVSCPIQGRSMEDFVSFMQDAVRSMGHKMELSLQSTSL